MAHPGPVGCPPHFEQLLGTWPPIHFPVAEPVGGEQTDIVKLGEEIVTRKLWVWMGRTKQPNYVAEVIMMASEGLSLLERIPDTGGDGDERMQVRMKPVEIERTYRTYHESLKVSFIFGFDRHFGEFCIIGCCLYSSTLCLRYKAPGGVTG
jgi:hypothetical protein